MSAQSQQGGPTSLESYTFVIQHNDGQPQSVTLRPQKGELNFAFGTPERRAAIWKVAVARKGEVYVMERSTGQLLKTSLHKSGDWRVQWIAGNPTGHPVVADAIEKMGTRIIDQWERPVPKFEGYTPAFAIMTSGDQIMTADPGAIPKRDMVWLSPPEVDEVGFIMLAYMKPTGQTIELKGYLPLAAFMMDTGEVVMIMAAKRTMKPDEARSLIQLRERLDEARDQLIAAGKYNDRQTRALVVGAQSEEGIRYLVDARMSRL
ncbi:hypothetical protein ACFFSW_21035 [Saccharothrix longispora]|uniref:Uncharacterized protein n=1 Tax=Saccharothrix longispora TaxID=33920 RepID=A0ABU1Q2V0_9PSEU|nr:hypothetical protein [Saccharothrix longispora]MDR6597233.1 hypothetical protein [Saccharothrix longispora]